jgi:capsular polysaccharide export protein
MGMNSDFSLKQACGSDSDKAIVFYVPSLFCLHLFQRMAPGLQARGWVVVFLTHRFSVWLRARLAGIRCNLLQPANGPVARPDCLPEKTAAVKLGRLSIAAAERVQDAVWQALMEICERFPVKAIGLWNGLHVESRAASAFARAYALRTIFFELGNIEPKLFVDPEGANAASLLARRPQILDSILPAPDEISAWRARLVERSAHDTNPPQAKGLANINFWLFLDRPAALLLRIPQPSPVSFARAVRRKLRFWLFSKPRSVKPLGRYVFLALQSSTDTNVLLFSQHDNLSAIAIAAKRAEELGVRLVVKPHPAERQSDFLSAVSNICASENHLLTSWNTAELISGAEEIIVINSSVGLEAKALGKPVTILGDSLYGAFSPQQIAAYALNHLLDFDPFGAALASPTVMERISALIEPTP